METLGTLFRGDGHFRQLPARLRAFVRSSWRGITASWAQLSPGIIETGAITAARAGARQREIVFFMQKAHLEQRFVLRFPVWRLSSSSAGTCQKVSLIRECVSTMDLFIPQ